MRRVRALFRNNDGVGSIEFVVWTPLFLALITLAFDIAITYYNYSRMWDAARYTARSAATGSISAEDAVDMASYALPAVGDYLIDLQQSEEMVVVAITGSGLSPAFGFIELFSPDDLTATLTMRRENF